MILSKLIAFIAINKAFAYIIISIRRAEQMSYQIIGNKKLLIEFGQEKIVNFVEFI